MLQFSRGKVFRIVAAVAVVIGLYAILGFVVAPRLVRSALLEDLPKSLNATPAVGEIHVNPFRFQITVDNFSLTSAGGEKLLAFQRLFIDFELSSIWHRAYSFVNIDITAPSVSAVMAQNRSLNLLTLVKPSTGPTPEKKEALPPIRIGSLKVTQGLVTYEDHSRPDVFAARLEPINFELHQFTTGVEGGKFSLTGASKLGERVEWHGHLSVDPLESDGEFQVSGLLAHTVWEYLQDQVNFVLDSGTINVAATYKFSVKDPTTDNLLVDVSTVALTDLTVRPKTAGGGAPEANWITVPALNVTGTTVDLTKRQAHVDLVSLSGVRLVTWLEADGGVNLMQLLSAPAGKTPTPVAATLTSATTTAAGAPAAGGPAWTFDLRRFEIRDASISAEDRSVVPAAKVVLAPLSLQVDGISQDQSKPVKVMLDTRIDEKGSLSVNGSVTPQPLVADVGVKLADVDLTTAQPYIAQHTAMTLMSGKLSGDATVHYGAQKKAATLQVVGNVSVAGVRTIDDALHDDFINWDRVDILGLNYSQAPDRLDIEQVVARLLYARVIIESDSSLNVKRVLKIPATVVPPAASAAIAAAADVAAAGVALGGVAVGDVVGGGNAVAAGNAAGTGGRGKGALPGPPTASAAAGPAQSMPMSIKKLLVQDSRANFTDLSVAPNFSAGIQKLTGSVAGLSSKPASRATVDLKGEVEAFSPVSIDGEINVLGPLYTDLTMSFHNISLAVFNPYSGKFAGYDITKGKLSTDLHYKVDGRKLDAQHHIVVEQLEFGDKTVSKDAVSLPIKLAMALLKDRNGVIDLNIPVTGSLDDPQFRLAPIIWKVFVNVLEKAVTSPFALLGSLFGGGPDIQFIGFQPGVSALDGPAMEKAKSVAKGLLERPQIKIDVPIAVVPELDRPALAAAQFNVQMTAALAAKGGAKKTTAGSGTPSSYDQLDPASQLDVLSRLYATTFGTDAKFSKTDVVAAKIDFLSKAIHEHIVVTDDDLQALGQQRALALQAALLADPEVVAERVFLVANDKAAAKDGIVELELSLK